MTRVSRPRVVLASQSPRRADILRQLGLEPEISPADVDESERAGEGPAAYVERLAREKAEAVAIDPAALYVGGDTTVVLDDEILSKPVHEQDAVAMLLRLAGRSHQVLSGVAVRSGGRTVSEVVRTTVRMRPFDEAVARGYVATGEPMDKAGGYGIQGRGAALVDSIDGDYYAVVGFPVGAFLRLLGRVGWHFDFASLRATDS